MRKTLPFIATALVSVMITAAIMQASAGAQVDPLLRAVGQPARVFGFGLKIEPCNSSPNNANEWHRFSRCSRDNFNSMKKWAGRLDKCMAIFEVRVRDDDVYGEAFDPIDPNVSQSVGDGLAPAAPGEGTFLMKWKGGATCPRT